MTQENSIEESQSNEISISEQIERTSVNITTFSALNPETFMPSNIPVILGGDDIIENENAKLEVEEAFGQLNIQSLFGVTQESLESCLYDTFHVGDNVEGRLTPHVYLLKSHTNSVYLLNLLTSPYADLNLDAYFNEVEFMSRSFSGVFRRTLSQLEKEIIDEDKQDNILRTTVDNLSGYMHYQIFQERGLREMVEGVIKKVTMMTLGMFIELTVHRDEYQCMGECGKTFPKDDALFQTDERDSCPECTGKLILAPPILKPKSLQFVFPEGAGKILGEEDPSDASPVKYVGLFTSVAMPRNIALTVNRLSSENFGSLATIPKKASFQHSVNSDEFMSLNTSWRRKENGNIFMFCTIGHTKYYGMNHLPFIPQLTAITINRKVIEGMDKGKTLDAILKSSIINDWVLTKNIDYTDIEKYDNLDNIPIFEKTGGIVNE